MDAIIALLNTLSTLSPLAVIGLLGTVIFLLVKGKQQVTTLQENHLHELPAIAAAVQQTAESVRSMW